MEPDNQNNNDEQSQDNPKPGSILGPNITSPAYSMAYAPKKQTAIPNQINNLPKKKSFVEKVGKKKIIIIGVLGLLLATALIIGVMLIISPSKKTTQQNVAATETSPDYLEPASAASLQILDNSISQDLNGIRDDRDLPENKLDDKSLGL